MAKTYIEGTSCKAVTGQFGEFFNISINVEKLQQYANEKGYVNLTLSKRKEIGQYGDTHYFTLNEWKPEGGNGGNGAPQRNQSNAPKKQNDDEEISVSDIPF